MEQANSILAKPNDGNVECATTLGQAGLLEMPNDERIVTGPFSFDAGADRLLGAAELGDRMEEPVWWRDAMHIDDDAWCSQQAQAIAQPVHVSRLFGGVDEALIPDTL
jgi:hypothetical protein